MSITILVTCDQKNRYGTCASFYTSFADTAAEARADAQQAGWWIATHGDYCPADGGRPPTTSGRSVVPFRKPRIR